MASQNDAAAARAFDPEIKDGVNRLIQNIKSVIYIDTTKLEYIIAVPAVTALYFATYYLIEAWSDWSTSRWTAFPFGFLYSRLGPERFAVLLNGIFWGLVCVGAGQLVGFLRRPEKRREAWVHTLRTTISAVERSTRWSCITTRSHAFKARSRSGCSIGRGGSC